MLHKNKLLFNDYMIHIIYFGFLKDVLGLSEEQFIWHGASSDELLDQLRQRGITWSENLCKKNIFRLAINQQIIYEPTFIKPGDEVAILPPVTGG